MRILLALILATLPLVSFGTDKVPKPSAKAKPIVIQKEKHHKQKAKPFNKNKNQTIKHGKAHLQIKKTAKNKAKQINNHVVTGEIAPSRWNLPAYMLTQSTLSPEEQAEQERKLLRYKQMLEQMWSLSRNYLHGNTVSRDLAKSYAWMYIYVNTLPATYPGMGASLAEIQNNMSEDDIARSEKYISVYRSKYGLNFRLSEEELNRMFMLQGVIAKPLPEDANLTRLPELPQLIEQLYASNKTVLAEKIKKSLSEAQKAVAEDPDLTIVYGRVIVHGADDPQGVAAGIPILEEGYFLSAIPAKAGNIHFVLNGFEPAKASVNRSSSPNNVGVIHLKPLSKSMLATVIGHVSPINKVDTINIALHPVPVANHPIQPREPWYWPQVHVSVVGTGQFFASGLSPARYRLVISSKGQILAEQEVDLTAGRTKQLGVLNLDDTPSEKG